MPPVPQKQVARPTKPSDDKVNVVDRIKPVKSRLESIMMSLYGRPKTGKTRLACTFPKPLLIIGSEDGTASVVGLKGVDFVQLRACSELEEVVQGPVRAGKYASVVFDNGTKFRDMRIKEILGLDRIPVQKGWGFAGRDQWVECANSMKQMLRPLLDLGRHYVLNIAIIAQEQNFSEEEGRGSDLISPNVGPAMGKSVCDWVNAECDYIGQTLIRPKMEPKTTRVNNQPKTTYVDTGRKEYCIRVGPHEVFQAGFRVPIGRELKEDFVVDPTYDKIIKLING